MDLPEVPTDAPPSADASSSVDAPPPLDAPRPPDAPPPLDRRHLITTGMITSRWATDAEARELYSQPNIDFVTYHDYHGTREFADTEYAVARVR